MGMSSDTLLFGTDISQYQSDFVKSDYDKLADVLDFVIIRTSVGSRRDTSFNRHYSEFLSRNAILAGYHYLLNEDIAGQVDLLGETGAPLDGYALDVEDSTLAPLTVFRFLAQWRNRYPDRPIGLYSSDGYLDKLGLRKLWKHFDWKWEALWGWSSWLKNLNRDYIDVDLGREVVHQFGGITYKAGDKDVIDGNAYRGSHADLMRLMRGESEWLL